jgi:hypothetical protein
MKPAAPRLSARGQCYGALVLAFWCRGWVGQGGQP